MYGASLPSAAGHGAFLASVPSAPINLVEISIVRTKSTLGLTWSDGATNGGLPILDYHVTYVANSSSSIQNITGVNARNYTALALTAGVTYNFRVYARNAYGISV